MEELTPEQKQQIEKIHAAKLDRISWISIEVAILLLFAGTLLVIPKWLMMTIYASAAIAAMISVYRRWSILLGKKCPVRLGFQKWLLLFQAVIVALVVAFRDYPAVLAVLALAFIIGHAYMLNKEIKSEEQTKE